MDFSKWLKVSILLIFLFLKNVIYNLLLWLMTVFFHNDLSFDSVEKINIVAYFLLGVYSLGFSTSKKRVQNHFKEFDSMSLKSVISYIFFFFLDLNYYFNRLGHFFIFHSWGLSTKPFSSTIWSHIRLFCKYSQFLCFTFFEVQIWHINSTFTLKF